MSEHLLYLSRSDVKALAIDPGQAREAVLEPFATMPQAQTRACPRMGSCLVLATVFRR